MTVNISNIDECFNILQVTDYWEQPSHDVCRKIIKFLNEYISQNPNEAKAYYLRSMAKFHLYDLLPPEYFWAKSSEYAKNKTYNEDEAYDDYKIAINIDSDIVQKIPDVMVITVSIHTGLKYYFRKPCPMKILEEIHINNKLYKEYCEKFERATHSEMK